jgi:tRNA threonylcarbamoyladenosine biosynthesis protein TsaB
MVMAEDLLKVCGKSARDVTHLAVAAGPGSFTGVRIGVAAAKGLAWGGELNCYGVSTLEAMAVSLGAWQGYICSCMDARRQQAYTGLYYFEGGKLQAMMEQSAVDISEIVEAVNAAQREVIFLGDGVPVFEQYLAEHVTVPYTFAPAHCNRQRAASVALLAQELYKQGVVETAAEHKPDYLRLSQAERELAERSADGEKGRDFTI